MSQLVLNNNSASNPQSIDLTPYMDVNEGQGMDLSDPAFTNRVWSRSLLKHGATLALEQLVEKELTFPLKIGPIGGVAGAPTTLSQTLQFVQNINMILETPGATATWQPVGASQPTTFDLLSGQLEVAYNYRAEQQRWTFGNLRLFTQPLGRTAAPRVYATASGVGPLLMISPYASSGALAVGASTQAGVAGFGGQQQGASSGVFYWGSPSLAGDAPALLQISYVGPLPNTATNAGVVPNVAVSILPDPAYNVLFPVIGGVNAFGGSPYKNAAAVASQYTTFTTQGNVQFTPLFVTASSNDTIPTSRWTGQHRLFAIARASGHPGYLVSIPNAFVPVATYASVTSADWALYDLGTFALRPSQNPSNATIWVDVQAAGVPSSTLDITALAMLPDNATWFLNATSIQASQYGVPNALGANAPVAAYTNTLVLDDILGDQFIYAGGGSQTSAPSPAGVQLTPVSGRVTPFSRGLVPQPDPKDGLPIIAILGVGQPATPSQLYVTQLAQNYTIPGASWANPQNIRTMAQVNVLEKARYVLP